MLALLRRLLPIFALGDCADIETRLAYLAGVQAKAVANNILADIAGKDMRQSLSCDQDGFGSGSRGRKPNQDWVQIE